MKRQISGNLLSMNSQQEILRVPIKKSLILVGRVRGAGQGGGSGGRKTGRKGGGRCTGDRRRGGGKRDSQGSGKREKKGKKLRNIAQYFAIEKMQRGGSQQIQDGNRD